MVANLAFASFGPFAQWCADSLGMPKNTYGKLNGSGLRDLDRANA
jgi:hypothetical protein